MSIIDLLQYAFIQKAFITGAFVAVTCSSLGLFLVLRNMSLIGDGLSHVSFGAIALGLFFGIYPYYVALPLVILASLLIVKISQQARIYGDAAIGIISAVGIASAVIFASLSRGFSVDLFSYLFGSILAISTTETILSVILSLSVLFVVSSFYWDLFSITFDEEYAKTTGIHASTINNLLTVLTAITVVLCVKVVGIMLVSALLILPAVTALQVSGRFRTALFIAALSALSSVLIGIVTSFLLDLPSGAVIVLVNVTLFVCAFIYRRIIAS